MPDESVAVPEPAPVDTAALLAPVEKLVSAVIATPDLEPTLQDPLAPVAV
jgi:hypothetical protein